MLFSGLDMKKKMGSSRGVLHTHTYTHTHTHTHRRSQSLQCLSWFNAETKLTADISGVFPRSLTRSLHVSDLKISPKRSPCDFSFSCRNVDLINAAFVNYFLCLFVMSWLTECQETVKRVFTISLLIQLTWMTESGIGFGYVFPDLEPSKSSECLP